MHLGSRLGLRLARSVHRAYWCSIPGRIRVQSSTTALPLRLLSTAVKADVSDIALPTLEDLYLRPGDNVVVAMSGGVDSSLTLQLLARLPLTLSVIFMRNWDPLLSESDLNETDEIAASPASLTYSSSGTSTRTPNLSPCAWERDWADVKRVCEHVGVPERNIRLIDLSREYWSRVFEPAVAVWEAGQTPNPDVACNREIKFGALMEHLAPGQYLATGHYARVVRSASGATLHRAQDANKDQTYYLSQVEEQHLARAVFPLATLPKPRVRELATHFNLPTATREESMGVCFIGERGRFGDFVSQYMHPPAAQGYLVDPSGKRIASHGGQWHYTIGQRSRQGGMDGRWFVARKGIGAGGNDILVVPGSDHPALQCESLISNNFHWIAGHTPDQLIGSGGTFDALVQVRHRMAPVPATVRIDTSQVEVEFQKAITAVAPGQIVALWHKDQCLGSGIIDHTQCADGD